MIVPQTDVYLLKVPLEISDLNQLTFANATAQFNYFNSLPKINFDNFTYQRKDGVLRIPALIDDIHQYNYVMYRNEAYSNKWFYAYIEHMEWLNDNVTAVKIRTDTWQTWFSQLTFMPTFVQREHTNDDTIGKNTIPESLECGEPVVNGEVLHMGPAQGYYITFMVSDITLLPLSFQSTINQVNGIFSGYTLFGVDGAANAQNVVKEFVDPTGTEGSFADAIKNIFLVPKELYGTAVAHNDAMERFSCIFYTPQQTLVPTIMWNTTTIQRIATLDGYQPHNNKLYTWPYSYLYLTNNITSNAEYHYEDFVDATPKFKLSGIVSPGCDIKVVPEYYKNVSVGNQAYGMKMGKLPVCSWNTDSYAIWMAQNQLNMRVSLTRNALKVGLGGAVGMVTGDFETAASGVSGYIGDVLNSMSERYIADHTPDESHGDVNSSDYNFSADLFFDFRRMSVRYEYAVIIDQYFDAYGYATNKVKVPNVTGRRNWNFVKTLGCYIKADIPQEDLAEIKSMFDKGITFWHNPSTFGDYSQNNDII